MFAALILLMSSLKQIDLPNYDSIQALKVMHDMGENRTSAPPGGSLGGFYFGLVATETPCTGTEGAMLPYYNLTWEVCMK